MPAAPAHHDYCLLLNTKRHHGVTTALLSTGTVHALSLSEEASRELGGDQGASSPPVRPTQPGRSAQRRAVAYNSAAAAARLITLDYV